MPRKITEEQAAALAVAAFSAIAEDEERMSRFLAVSGLHPDTIREAARSPRFFAGVLDYVVSDEPLLVSLAQQLDVPPDRIMAAHLALSPSEFS